ncbi:YceI family protein [uncultured Polaribacter sp.]|uniref:YceI family protein n=1 Tax=uncultured Polaribacter sp. TaxID=174711 RepID=UPI00259BCD17|nr:YceI family protein [uncultured Polaribacter sp.]
MFIRLKICFIFWILFSCLSFSQELVTNKQKSSISFRIKNFGFNVKGTFTNFTVKSRINLEDLESSFFNVQIPVKSIFTNSKSRDKHLLKPDFFDVQKHPFIVFKSSEFTSQQHNKIVIKGDLIIKGIQKKIKATINVRRTDNNTVFTTKFKLNRKDFNVGGTSLVLSNTVNVTMIYVANRN